MANDNQDQNEYGLPTPGNNKITSARLLPRFFRTQANKKFLQATLDQLIQPGVAEKINGYYGRINSKAYTPGDNYVGDVSDNRNNYQFEPAAVIKNDLDNVTFYKDYNDYMNQLKLFGSNTDNHSLVNSQETYGWNPNIDWDKFVNFREYYWMPTGPQAVPVRGQSQEVVSTYTVTVVEEDDNFAFLFNDGLERNPSLKLYRGQRYRFEIDTPGHPFSIAITRSFIPGTAIVTAGAEGLRGPSAYDVELYGNENDIGDYIILPSSGGVTFNEDENVSTIYGDGIIRIGEEGEQVANVYIEKGVIEFTIPLNAPDKLFYISKNAVDTSGYIKVFDIEENTFLNVDSDILGKKYYTSANGVEFSNGLKVYFQGNITPDVYEEGFYYVEGVGEAIKLVNEEDLIIPATYSSDELIPYDSNGFDRLPFSSANAYPGTKDYIVINRASKDRNPWTRYNRWFHRQVLEKSFEYNGLPIDIDESTRARRPIIEFEAGLKLYNFGSEAKADVDLVDTFTTDVFSKIEGQLGYNIDGVDLAQGMRILFTADPDILVNGKIYQVNFVQVQNENQRQISLVEVEDSEPQELETVLVKDGENYAGKIFYYENRSWSLGQDKTLINQEPLFDLCCPQGNFFGDTNVFDSSTFKGTKIFSYKIGEGSNDTELGFPLTYKNIENSGDIVFEFNLLTDSFLVQTDSGSITVTTDVGNLRKYSDRTNFKWVNAWSSTPRISKQRVFRQYDATNDSLNNFAIDVYNKSGNLNDLEIIVYKNNKFQKYLTDYDIDRINGVAYVRFYNDLNVNDVVLIKTHSAATKNSNGWYEFPHNLERNPNNDDIREFTLGEVIDHVDTMIEEIQTTFEGSYPGPSNLRDLGDLDIYGKRFVKHNGPINLPLYHITNKDFNVVKAIEYSKKEYSKFKRTFVDTATNLGYDGPTKQHVDKVLFELNRDKIKTQPFYFTDMIGAGSSKRIEYEVLDANNPYYALSNVFSLAELSNKSVTVYINGKQLTHNRDYTFSDNGFVLIDAGQVEGDTIEIYEYDNTDGSFIPPTPTKLGLYPKYEPELVLDDTYVTDSVESVTFNNLQYTTNALAGTGINFSVNISLGVSNYNVTLIEGGSNYSVGDKVVVNGTDLNGISPANNLTITVTEVNDYGTIVDFEITGLSPSISIIGPYKIYGETENRQRGWFYPVYFSKSTAASADTSNETTLVRFKGLNKIIYIPTNVGVFGGQDSLSYDEYLEAIPMIKGHDGSFIKAYKDYRDELLIDLEKRIFNNIKIEYNTDLFDIHNFLGGKFRSTDFSREEINNTMLKDFIQWLSIIKNDYTDNNTFDRNNHFTFNYSRMNSAVDGTSLPGFWRGVYKEVYDTDRPHTHPWEMLGFSIKPTWWDTVYGPAPYTSNNLVLWEDLEAGRVRDPNDKVRIRNKYVRPGLLNFIPSDSQGNLKTPIDVNYAKNFFFRYVPSNWKFGDEAPVETAWRRSSEYPFALLRAYLLNKPAEVMGITFDYSRVFKNLAGQYVYSETLKNVKLSDYVLPNTYQDNARVSTSGLVNYLYNLLASNILTVYDDYKNDLANLKNQLGMKIGGYTDKSKFKLVLDSRSPRENFVGGIYVPDENYQIFLNTSSPIDDPTYSGVIVEKLPGGFSIRGYDYDNPQFTYHPVVETSRDVTVVVGGITEATTTWAANKQYFRGQVVEHDSKYYRATQSFTSGVSFVADNLAELPELPIVGGRRAKFRRNFDKKRPRTLSYGSTLTTIQEVVDFILGYESYLKSEGFEFNFFNNVSNRVENWDLAAREFLYWTTQGWAAGTSITLSPSAYQLFFNRSYSVVDDIYDNFYDYSLLKADGLLIERKFSSILRDSNTFGVETRNTDDGIYNIKLPLVQKEHVVILDNTTTFSDVIYQPSTGYRQERIKVLGYRSDNWNGGLNIPGFVYDDATAEEWTSWKDYPIGSLVKYKQFYYVAIYTAPGSEDFVSTYWLRLNKKPESDLYTNFDYRINQFTDFYDLDTDGFDSEQQRLAQHLIGYQKREYLANIINDDVSQYKFYQGFIQDKGTKNAMDKLFNPLSSANQDSFEYNEEWAIQVGRFGATDTVKQVEYIMKEDFFQESPQPIELVNSLPTESYDKIFRILPSDVYDKPTDYNHSPFPTTNLKEYILSGGYVHEDDIEYKAGSLSDLQDADVNQVSLGEYIWLTDDNLDDWTVYQIDNAVCNVSNFINTEEVVDRNTIYEVTVDKWSTNLFEVDDVIGILNAQGADLYGFYQVTKVEFDRIYIGISSSTNVREFSNSDGAVYPVIKLRKVRVDDLNSLNTLVQNKVYDQQRIWVDNFSNGDWTVLENNKVYSLTNELANPESYDSTDHEFSYSMTVNDNNRELLISAPGNGNGSVHYYKRTKETDAWNKEPDIDLPKELFDYTDARFGNSVSISEDGEYLAIGIPYASSVKSRFKGNFNPAIEYNKNDIVKYRESLWKANRTILPETDNQQFSSFDTYTNLVSFADNDSSVVNLIVSGNLGVAQPADHILVRAPLDMYRGTKSGDRVKLQWNTASFSYNDGIKNTVLLPIYQPFNGSISGVNSTFLNQTHIIQEKVDHIFFIDAYISLPDVGDVVESNIGSGTVVYVENDIDSAVIYINNTSGLFFITDELFKIDPVTNERQFVGFYTEETTINLTDNLGGFWLIKTRTDALNEATAFTYSHGGNYLETGKGLVYVDVLTQDLFVDPTRPYDYTNIVNTVTEVGQYVTLNRRSSFITQLSYFGDPAISDGVPGTEAEQPSNLWVIKAPKDYTDNLTSGDTFKLELFESESNTVDFTNTGLTYDIINGEQTVYDLWDGYIDFEFSRFDFSGFPFQPQIGDILEDVQIPFDEFGGLAITSTTTSSAEVVFLQRNFNKLRVYIKFRKDLGYTGEWTKINNIARVDIRRKANEDIRGIGDVDRIIGTIEDFENDVIVVNDPIGQLIVFQASSNFPIEGEWDSITPIVDKEYYFYDEALAQDGAPRESNIPNGLNKDYKQVYNIPADYFGTEGPANEGVVAIYRKAFGTFKLQTVLTSEFAYDTDGTRTANRFFGSKVSIVKNNSLYTLFVSNDDPYSVSADPLDIVRGNNGSIEIFKHGTERLEEFLGNWNPNISYEIGSIVKYKGDFYRAINNVNIEDNVAITNIVYWNNISWQQGKDQYYRGEWNNNAPYIKDSIVSNNGKLYKALTNIAKDAAFSANSWIEIVEPVDYLGYLPNLTGITYFDENTFDPAQNITQFAKDFSVSKTGSVLVVKSTQQTSDSTESDDVLLVYRLLGSKYVLSQTIVSPDRETGWAYSFSINPAGTKIAIGVPFDDRVKKDEGKVLVYSQQNGSFVLTQTLISPRNEVAEKFGYTVSYSKDNLVVTSRTGDMKLPTTFDITNDIETTFDKGFTEFSNMIVDSGNIYIYEEISNSLIFSESFRYDSADFAFGENLLTKDNFVYVGMPLKGDDQFKGTVLEYRKVKNTFAWNTKRELLRPVDVDKLRGAFLYNRRTNQIVTYLDYIDPIQGKIAGPAEQEIMHKVGYDPARYNVDSRNNFKDIPVHWAEEHVGELWWNISTAKFTYPYHGSILYQKENWNELQPDATIEVYEWVESDLLPSQWDALADTEKGMKVGISGLSLYGDDRYSQKFIYDNDSQSFGVRYYYWVLYKRTVPTGKNRRISAFSVAELIARPREQGYRYISFLSDNRFILNNCDSLIYNDDIVLNVRYSTSDATREQNLHSQYQILSDGNDTSMPHPDIERKWFDSLIGFDEQQRHVPDLNLTVKQKYGIQNKPRQSMFINRFEALKQVIERINRVLKETIVVDELDLSDLLSKEQAPTEFSREWDQSISTYDEIRFVSTNKLTQATLQPVVVNGNIVSVNITNPGRGYKVAPKYTISGEGQDAEFEITINNLGQITNVEVLNRGSGYTANTIISVRRYSVLVESDLSLNGKWAIYSWNETTQEWFKRSIQDFDVTLYWDYIDWYATGYNEFTSIDYSIDESYQLDSLDDSIGNIIKINNVGSGGWLLLEKIDNRESEDYTVNYNTIGRQNGTIKFLDTLYDFSKNTVGFDNRTYDSMFYDNDPSRELRIIFNAIRDKIFIGDLRVEYNQLFFSSLRYILSEQNYVDWMFKTSFIKVKHNLGELIQDITFNNNTLPSYQAYVNEVKPYKTVIREFVSAYEKTEPTNTVMTDFDLPAAYNNFEKKILPNEAIVLDNVVDNFRSIDTEYPRKHWFDNNGYTVTEIKIANGGSGYTYKPTVTIQGGGGTGATAEAYLGYGAVTSIKITNPGSGYYTAPEVIIQGPQTDGGVPAVASAVIGNGLVRTPSIKIKFDRTAGTYTLTKLTSTETFTGTNVNTSFDLKWPVDVRPETITVTVDGEEKLRSEFSVTNVEYAPTTSVTGKEFTYDGVDGAAGPGLQKITNGYTYYKGRISFTSVPANGAVIVVNYKKDLSLLGAEDRIYNAYEPEAGMFGKDLSQLMTGIDYGGVEVTSFDFGGEAGWDTTGWYTDNWDEFDNSFEDLIFTFDGSTIAIDLDEPLEDGITYNVYYKATGTETGKEIRLDDPNYGTVDQTNPNAIISSIVGDGVTQVIELQELGIKVNDNDVLIVRKISSDGSFIPDPESYDTALSGGDLAYSTAKGINAEEINVDGDGFVTPITSNGPEELIPGQVLDTLDLKVYTRDSDGQGMIYSQNYIMDASVTTYDLGVIPSNKAAVLIKLNNAILADDEYTVNWKDRTVTILNPQDGVELSIIAVAQGGANVLDYGSIITDDSTVDYETPVDYIEDIVAHITVDGETIADAVILESETTGRIVIRLPEPQVNDSVIRFTFFDNNDQVNYSQMTKETFVITEDTTSLTLGSAPFYAEPTAFNTIVKKNNTILNAGYNIQYTVPPTRTREYPLEAFQQPGNTIQTDDIKVFINGEEVSAPVQWRYEVFTSVVVLSNEVGAPGDKIEIYVVTDGDYRLSSTTMTFTDTLVAGDTVEVYKFSNHDLVEMERINYDVVARETLIPEDIEYVTYNRLTVGEITLRAPAVDAKYVWVAVNGELLSPSVDYSVSEDGTKLRLLRKPAEDDVIDVIQFVAPVVVPKFAFRQFKDILNRTHYKRLDASAAQLAQPLNYYDLRIEVVDASQLPEPDKSRNRPGIIFVDGERIEYFVKEDNTLRQLRRGTLGTGVKETYAIGTKIFDASARKTIPYQDVTQTQVITADGNTSTFVLNFTATTIHAFEVFVGGRRLRKNAISMYQFEQRDANGTVTVEPIAQDSPAGDNTVAAEFTFDSGTNSITLTETPAADQKINIVRKVGKLWKQQGETLAESQTDIAYFLRAGTTELPE